MYRNADDLLITVIKITSSFSLPQPTADDIIYVTLKTDEGHDSDESVTDSGRGASEEGDVIMTSSGTAVARHQRGFLLAKESQSKFKKNIFRKNLRQICLADFPYSKHFPLSRCVCVCVCVCVREF